MTKFSPEEKAQLLQCIESFMDYDLRAKKEEAELQHANTWFESQIETITTTTPVGKHGSKTVTTRRIKDPDAWREELDKERRSNMLARVLS